MNSDVTQGWAKWSLLMWWAQVGKPVGWDGSDAHHGEGIPIVPREMSVRTVTFHFISKVIWSLWIALWSTKGGSSLRKVSYRWWVLSTAVLLLDLSPQRHGFVLCFKAVHCFECAKLHVLLKGEGLISRVGIEHLFFLSLRSNLCGETWVNSKSLVPMESLHHSLWGCCFEVCC